MSLFSSFGSSEVIKIVDGRAVSVKARHSRKLLSDIEDVCRDFDITQGRIALAGNGKLSFPKHFPAAAHQALRNVIMNHL